MAPSRVRIPPSPLARRTARSRPSAEGWQSGRMRRSRKPLSVVRRIEGSNPSPSALPAEVDAGKREGIRLAAPAHTKQSHVRCACQCGGRSLTGDHPPEAQLGINSCPLRSAAGGDQALGFEGVSRTEVEGAEVRGRALLLWED